MTPEATKNWQEALLAFQRAERYLVAGDGEKATKEAGQAKALAVAVMLELYPTPEELAKIGLGTDFSDSLKPSVSPRDCVNGARRFLRQCINLSPTQSRLWGEEELRPPHA